MALFQLPAGLLMLLAATSPTFASPTVNVSAIYYTSSGSGSSYASACQSAYNAYSSASNSWVSKHATVDTQTLLYGGISVTDITYYANATTLCDGHPRVSASLAVPLSTKTHTTSVPVTSTTVALQTGWMGDPPGPSPICSIAPSDCDPLWQSYSESLKSYQSHAITVAPHTPPCLNSSGASSVSSFSTFFTGCGLCTIYGEGVELLYFPVPTTVSRDMCASTQSASLTHYNSGDVQGVYAGTSFGNQLPNTANAKTAVVNGHTFTSGTAYISISKVYAMNRCTQTLGHVVNDAIIAMSSSAVLSLRYSQDHFQYIASTDRQTGYPVSYADFNSPVPYSAWVGQTQCDGPQDDYNCGIIYENNYRPQLAIPPAITSLASNWSDCQVYFRGLYDPPLDLDAVATIARPTLPFSPGRSTSDNAAGQYTPASPVNGPTTPHAPATTTPTAAASAIPDTQPTQSRAGSSDTSGGSSNERGSGVGSNGSHASGSSHRGHDEPHHRNKETITVYHQQQAHSEPAQGAPPAAGTTTTLILFEKTIITVIQAGPTAPVQIEGQGIHTTISAGQQAVTFKAEGDSNEQVIMSAVKGGVVINWEGSAVQGVSQSSNDDQDNAEGGGSGTQGSSAAATSEPPGGVGSSGSGPSTQSPSSQVPTQTRSDARRAVELSALAVVLAAMHFVI